VDQEVTPGTTYQYFVKTVNIVGLTGPATSPAEVFVPPAPTILSGDVAPHKGRATDTFRFQVELRDMQTASPSVWLLLNDAVIPIDRVDATADCRTSCTYVYADRLAPLDVQVPDYTYRVEVVDGVDLLTYPAEGTLAGPIVLAGGAEGEPLDTGLLPGVPGPSLLALLFVTLCAALGVRARRQRR
jgi:hypothetical protein